MVAPRAPPRAVRNAVTGSNAEEEEDEELLRLRLPPDAPQWQRAVLAFARRRLRLPEGLLALAVHAGLRFWLGLLAWMAGARAAAAWELGPIYIIGSIIAVMLLNLGTRREGEWSAYRCACWDRGRAVLARCGAASVRSATQSQGDMAAACAAQGLWVWLGCAPRSCQIPTSPAARSLFNPGMRRLPGQMTAEQLDAQVRRGQM